MSVASRLTWDYDPLLVSTLPVPRPALRLAKYVGPQTRARRARFVWPPGIERFILKLAIQAAGRP